MAPFEIMNLNHNYLNIKSALRLAKSSKTVQQTNKQCKSGSDMKRFPATWLSMADFKMAVTGEILPFFPMRTMK